MADTRQLLRDERGIKRSFCQPRHKHKNSPSSSTVPPWRGIERAVSSPSKHAPFHLQEAVMLMWRSFLYLMICFCGAKCAKILPPFFFCYLEVKQGSFGNIPPVAEDYQRNCKWCNRRITPLPCPGSFVCSSLIISSFFFYPEQPPPPPLCTISAPAPVFMYLLNVLPLSHTPLYLLIIHHPLNPPTLWLLPFLHPSLSIIYPHHSPAPFLFISWKLRPLHGSNPEDPSPSAPAGPLKVT